jgi:hypothetical protein
MSVTLAIVIGIAMGIMFGFALEKSRVFEPGIIVGQMQLRNFIMLKVFLTAVATGAVVLAVLNGFGYVKLQPKAAAYAADVVGGLLLGAGISLSGACPGTTLAQIGAGYRTSIHTCWPVRRCRIPTTCTCKTLHQSGPSLSSAIWLACPAGSARWCWRGSLS